MTIGIIVAMDKELQLLLDLFSHEIVTTDDQKTFYVASLSGEKTLVITQSGIGKVNAAIATMELLHRYQPMMIISTGVAGAAQSDILPLQIVVATATAYHDVYCGPENLSGQVQGMPATFPADERLLAVATTLDGVTTGLIASGDWFVDTIEKVRDILAIHPTAVAVDMESAAIAHVCYRHHCPCLAMRIISDNPLQPHSADQYRNFWSTASHHSFTTLVTLLQQLR